MIIDDPENYWIRIEPLKKKQRDEQGLIDWLEHRGKWLIFDKKENLDELAKRLDAYVEDGDITSAKYNREAGLSDEPVMCVYCDDRNREKVRKILTKLGVTKPKWKYERQTNQDWQPGGRLNEKDRRKFR